MCMEPYERFERQVKEVTGLIDEPIGLIDGQLKEIEEKRRQQKQKDIEELFKTIGFQDFIVLERIMDPKWLNATVSLGKIEEQMKNILFKVGTEVATISSLPEFSFEALEIYKKTLDLNQAIAEGQRLAEIQKKNSSMRKIRNGLPLKRQGRMRNRKWQYNLQLSLRLRTVFQLLKRMRKPRQKQLRPI